MSSARSWYPCMRSCSNRSDRESPIVTTQCTVSLIVPSSLPHASDPVIPSPGVTGCVSCQPQPATDICPRIPWPHLLGGKFRGQIMLSPETFTWDRRLYPLLFTLPDFTPLTPSPESTLILPLPDNVLHNLFSVSGSTQFSCSRGRIMWK